MTSGCLTRAGVGGRLIALSLLGFFAGISVAQAQSQIGKAPPLVAAPGKVQQAAPPSINYGPMDFYVATGSAGACGPNCSEWIAADGKFDLGAGQRFKEFVNSPRRRGLPVFFESQGGFLSDGIEVAQVLREYQMTAGVGRTTPNGCTAQRLAGGVCDQLVKSGKDVPSKIAFTGAQCHSACVFALAGATQRKIALGVLIGVHSPRNDEILWKQYADAHPGATRMSPEVRHLNLWRLILSLGVDPALVDIADSIDPSKIRILSRDEITRFGLETNKQFETPWRTNPDLNMPVRFFKLVNMGGGSNLDVSRTVTVALTCKSPSELILTYQRRTLAYEPVRMLQVQLTVGNVERQLVGQVAGSIGVWGTIVGYQELRNVADNSPIRISETFPNGGAPLGVTLANAGFAPTLVELQKYCSERNLSAVTTGEKAN